MTLNPGAKGSGFTHPPSAMQPLEDLEEPLDLIKKMAFGIFGVGLVKHGTVTGRRQFFHRCQNFAWIFPGKAKYSCLFAPTIPAT